MLKKTSTLILSGVILVVLIAAGYLLLHRNNEKTTVPAKAIPLDAAVILETSDFHGLLTSIYDKSEVWKELVAIDKIKQANERLLYIDSLITSNELFKKLTRGNVFISIHHLGKTDADLVFYSSLPGKISESDIRDAISALCDTSGNISKREYAGQTIYDLRCSKAKDDYRNMSFATPQGILIISHSSILLEDAIRQLKQEKSIPDEPGFKKVAATAGKNVEANLYLNFKTLPRLLSSWLKPEYREKTASFNSFADWAELDLNIKEESLFLNGFTTTGQSAGDYLNIFQKQEPGPTAITSVLPSNTVAFLSFGMNNTEQFFRDYKNYLAANSREQSRSSRLTSIGSTSSTNPEDLFASIIDNEVAQVFTDFKSFDLTQNTFTVIKIKSRNQAEQKMYGMIKGYAKNAGKNPESFVSDMRFDSETTFKIYECPYSDLSYTLFGPVFRKGSDQYFTFIGNYMVFGESKKSLNHFIHFNILQKTMQTDIDYQKFAENITTETNFYFYCNIAHARLFLSRYLSDQLAEGLEHNATTFQKFQAMAVQLNTSGKMIYNNLFFRYSSVYREEPKTVWETLLDTSIDFKPTFVINHYTREREIVVQDQKNNLYLINKVGRVLWKLHLPEKIMSDIYQVDYYRNGKLQMLFNTKNYLFLLDRNGNNVEKYPVRFRSPATNPMALFDYDNNRDYRILIAAENKKVYNYGIDGSLIQGWDFNESENTVTNKIEHFRIGIKDYIVFKDKYRVYILNRRGETRVPVDAIIPSSVNNNLILEANPPSGDPRMALTDTAGTVYYIYFTGRAEKKEIGRFSPDHFFDYQDVDADGKKDFIFLDKNKLQVINQQKKTLFTHQFENEINLPPVYYQFSTNDRKIGVVASKAAKIYLFNNDGSIYEGFPLRGQTLFTIGEFSKPLNKFNLIVGSEDNFLYNYSVQ